MTVSSDSLLSAPMSGGVRAEVRFDRCIGKDYSNLSDRFLLPGGKDYTIQYYHIYRIRYSSLRPLVEASVRSNAKLRETPIKHLSALSALSAEESEKGVVIIGTLFKIQKNKPNILRELEGDLSRLSASHHYTSDDDSLVLEDEEQRITLIGEAVQKHELFVTGIVLGAYGRQNNAGKFRVEEIFFPESLRIKRYIPSKPLFIAFLSNVQVSTSSPKGLQLLQLAIDWLTGFEGCPRDQETNASIERVIMTGGILGGGSKEGVLDNVTLFEKGLLQLVKSLKVDLVPGHSDHLSNASFPQQPLHKCLFPSAAPYSSTLQTVTNPYFFQMEDTLIYGSSGKNVEDVSKNSSLSEPLDVLEQLLLWAHISPTSPDTLGCFPYKDKDPFVMDKRPHVLFSGNGDNFQKRVVEDTLLLSLPNFAATGSLVLLNLKDLSTQEVKFSI